jgi:glycosyltransferase involved in cell wall biosynthesis
VTKKTKVLWIADFAAMTGFGRVSGAVLPRLREGFEFVVLACNWHGDPVDEQKLFKMYPASNRFQQAPFGEDRIREIVEKERPDIVFSLNDPWIVSEQYRRIQDLHQQKKFKFVGYLTMDSYNWLGGIDPHINDWDGVIAFTEFGAHEFVKSGVRIPIAVIPHGLDRDVFYPMDQEEAREKLGLKKDIFIVLNGNRNQFRKRMDITVAAFAKFAVGRPDAQLYMHMGLKDQGWDLMPLFAREMGKNGLDPNGRIIMTSNSPNPPNVSTEMLNWIYNCADVGVNTTKGGGWELVNFENAACRVAQVVPDHTSTKEVFEGYGRLIRCDHIDVDTNYGREMPCPSTDHLVEILCEMYENKDARSQVADACYARVTDEQFSWDTIASQFGGIFEDVMNEVDHGIEGAKDEVSVETKNKKKRKRRSKGREPAVA